MFIQISQLKNYPSSNLNRDDNGMPKSCLFGNVQRGRISSQCIKYNMRTDPSFIDALAGSVGIRTRHLPTIVADKLVAAGADTKYVEAAKAIVKAKVEGKEAKADKKAAKIEPETGEESTANNNGKEVVTQIMFFSDADVDATIKAVLDAYKASSSLSEFKQNCIIPDAQPITADIALFGRMSTADKTYCNVESAMQVAHAISTHKLSSETDYFTAVDDCSTNGAGHVNSFDFNSCCYYEYANIDVKQLAANLAQCDAADENLLRSMILGTIQAFAFTNPAGKQNSFAAHVRPSAFLVEISDRHLPINYANAFVKPARAGYDKDLVAASIEKLCGEVSMMDHDFGTNHKHRFWFCTSNYAADESCELTNVTKKCATFPELLEAIETVLKEEL